MCCFAAAVCWLVVMMMMMVLMMVGSPLAIKGSTILYCVAMLRCMELFTKQIGWMELRKSLDSINERKVVCLSRRVGCWAELLYSE
jgi:hypothetical protein